MRYAAILPWICGVLGVAYLVTAAQVVVHRARFDSRRRLLRQLEALLPPSNPSETAERDDQARAVAFLARQPGSILLRLAAESTMSLAAHEALAASLLARIGHQAAHRDASSRKNGWRRFAALRILTYADREAAWVHLERALVDGDPEVKAATVTLLGQVADRRAAMLLVEAMTANRYARSRIATSLQACQLDIGDLIVPLLAAPDSQLRYWGAILIRRYPVTSSLEARLGELAEDPDPTVRKAAVETLGVAGLPGSIPTLRARLLDPVPFVRAHAARALGSMRAVAAVDAISPLLADGDWSARSSAKQALEAMGPAVVPTVLKMLSHADGFAKNGAAEVLQNLGVFEQLVEQEALGAATIEHLRICELLARAGGVPMWDTVILRLSPEAQGRARQILASMKLAPVF